MSNAVRLGDSCSGHCFPPRENISGSNNVIINGLPAHRFGDSWANHSCGDETHDGVTVGGSSTVFINGLAAVRVGDAISCGSTCANGSPNVYIGG